MKKLFAIIMASALMMPMFAATKAQVRAAVFGNDNNYDAKLAGVGTAGSKALQVTGYGKKMEGAVFQAEQNAIHAMIFKGCAGNSAANVDELKPLYGAPAPKPEDEEFFDNFFAPEGIYSSFIANRGARPLSSVDMGKGYYQVKLLVQVNFDNLRKYLEEQGKIKAFGADLKGAAKPTMMVFPSDILCNKLGYMDANGTPDYRRAVLDENLSKLETTFADFMAQNGYAMATMGQEMKKMDNDNAFNMADHADGTDKAISMREKLLQGAKPDMVLEFNYAIKSDAGQKFVEFEFRTVDAATSKILCSNVARGTSVTGDGQMVNQLKEAILNVKDKFLGDVNTAFARMAKEGREIEVTVDRFESCPINFSKKYDGEPLSALIQQIIEGEIVEGQALTVAVSTANQLRFTQVHIGLTYEKKYTVGKKKGTTEQVNQTAGDFGQRVANEITDLTGQQCRVEPRGTGRVFVTMGLEPLDEDEY